MKMTEEEALGRIDEIGQAFANDYNDGDGPDYEGLHTSINNEHELMLTYVATNVDEDGEQEHVVYHWTMELKEFPGED